jgi:hypothetical protein
MNQRKGERGQDGDGGVKREREGERWGREEERGRVDSGESEGQIKRIEEGKSWRG